MQKPSLRTAVIAGLVGAGVVQHLRLRRRLVQVRRLAARAIADTMFFKGVCAELVATQPVPPARSDSGTVPEYADPYRLPHDTPPRTLTTGLGDVTLRVSNRDGTVILVGFPEDFKLTRELIVAFQTATDGKFVLEQSDVSAVYPDDECDAIISVGLDNQDRMVISAPTMDHAARALTIAFSEFTGR